MYPLEPCHSPCERDEDCDPESPCPVCSQRVDQNGQRLCIEDDNAGKAHGN